MIDDQLIILDETGLLCPTMIWGPLSRQVDALLAAAVQLQPMQSRTYRYEYIQT